ncbi:MAG: hypothetical protein RMI91_00325 [Gemmatales bacterium]|nr:hypothetical protein [Gemmatales bacterium]MDW7993076.1 hypothetical protein [Gemmatales bacterium]
MHVGALRQYLNGLAEVLRSSGAKAVAQDLERAATALAPFDSWTIAQWAEFLARAEEYHRTGVITAATSRKPTAKSVDHNKIDQALQRIRELESRLFDEDFAITQIEITRRQLDKELSKDEALALAEQLGHRGCKTKKAALDTLTSALRERCLQHRRLSLIQST